MKKNLIIILAMLALIMFCFFAPFNDCIAGDSAEILSEAGEFFLGFTIGFAWHESGHQSMADLHNKDMRWNINFPNYFYSTWTVGKGSQKEMRQVAIGGMANQILSSEVILNTPEFKRNTFALGWLTFNIVNGLGYVIKHETTPAGYGDFHFYKRNGGNDKIFEAIVVSHSLLSAYRILNNEKPWFDVRMEGDKILVSKTIFSW